MPDAAASAELVLGSASPRRADLLGRLGVAHRVESVTIDEAALVANAPTVPVAVERVARAKFAAFASLSTSTYLLTADTLVACDGLIMGKPDNPDHVAAMLRTMSGRSLTISTALCHGRPRAEPNTQVVTTVVQLRALSEADIAGYVATGVGADKAAALALQTEAEDFIARVDGCWSNVLGLPLCAVAAALDGEPHAASRAARCSVDLCGPWG